MTKDELRSVMRQRRRSVSAASRLLSSAALCKKLLARPEVATLFASSGTLCVYLATPQELDLGIFIAEARSRGCTVVAPRWRGGFYDLAVLPLSSADLTLGPSAVLEPPSSALALSPASVSLWVVPGLAFSNDGSRLGYGGGWYDRLLARADPAAPIIGVGYAFQRVESLAVESHDHPVSAFIGIEDHVE